MLIHRRLVMDDSRGVGEPLNVRIFVSFFRKRINGTLMAWSKEFVIIYHSIILTVLNLEVFNMSLIHSQWYSSPKLEFLLSKLIDKSILWLMQACLTMWKFISDIWKIRMLIFVDSIICMKEILLMLTSAKSDFSISIG